MVFFPNNLVTIYKEIEDERCGTIGYKGKYKKCLLKVADVTGDFQDMQPSEVVKQFGSLDQNGAKLFLPEGTEIASDYKVTVAGRSGIYQVKGEPMVGELLPGVTVLLVLEGVDLDQEIIVEEPSP